MAAPAFGVGRNMDHPHLKGKFTLKVWIPTEQTRLVIGKGGENLQGIKRSTRVKSIDCPAANEGLLWAPVLITGDPTSSFKAYQAIAGMVDEVDSAAVAEFPLYMRRHPIIVGPGGSTLKRISADNAVRISIPKNGFGSDQTRPDRNLIQLEGGVEPIFSSLAMIIEAVYGFRATTLVGPGIASPPTSASAGTAPQSFPASAPTSTTAPPKSQPEPNIQQHLATNLGATADASAQQSSHRHAPAANGVGDGSAALGPSAAGSGSKTLFPEKDNDNRTRTPARGSDSDTSAAGLNAWSEQPGGNVASRQQERAPKGQTKGPFGVENSRGSRNSGVHNRDSSNSKMEYSKPGGRFPAREEWPASAGVRKQSNSSHNNPGSKSRITAMPDSTGEITPNLSTGPSQRAAQNTREQSKAQQPKTIDSDRATVRQSRTCTLLPQQSQSQNRNTSSGGGKSAAAPSQDSSATAAVAARSRTAPPRDAYQNSNDRAEQSGSAHGIDGFSQPRNEAVVSSATRDGGDRGQQGTLTVAERAQAAVVAARQERVKATSATTQKQGEGATRNVGGSQGEQKMPNAPVMSTPGPLPSEEISEETVSLPIKVMSVLQGHGGGKRPPLAKDLAKWAVLRDITKHTGTRATFIESAGSTDAAAEDGQSASVDDASKSVNVQQQPGKEKGDIHSERLVLSVKGPSNCVEVAIEALQRLGRGDSIRDSLGYVKKNSPHRRLTQHRRLEQEERQAKARAPNEGHDWRQTSWPDAVAGTTSDEKVPDALVVGGGWGSPGTQAKPPGGGWGEGKSAEDAAGEGSEQSSNTALPKRERPEKSRRSDRIVRKSSGKFEKSSNFEKSDTRKSGSFGSDAQRREQENDKARKPGQFPSGKQGQFLLGKPSGDVAAPAVARETAVPTQQKELRDEAQQQNEQDKPEPNQNHSARSGANSRAPLPAREVYNPRKRQQGEGGRGAKEPGRGRGTVRGSGWGGRGQKGVRGWTGDVSREEHGQVSEEGGERHESGTRAAQTATSTSANKTLSKQARSTGAPRGRGYRGGRGSEGRGRGRGRGRGSSESAGRSDPSEA